MPAARRLVDHFPELAARDRIDAAGRLVEEDDARLVEQRDRERQLLPPAERDRADELIGGVLEPEAREHPAGAVADVAIAQVVDAAVERDVLADGEVLVEREALAHVADVALDALGLAGDVVSGDGRAAGGGREQTGQHPDRGGLAGAVRAEEAEHLAGADVEGDAVDGGEGAEAARQIGDVDREVAALMPRACLPARPSGR